MACKKNTTDGISPGSDDSLLLPMEKVGVSGSPNTFASNNHSVVSTAKVPDDGKSHIGTDWTNPNRLGNLIQGQEESKKKFFVFIGVLSLVVVAVNWN